MSNNKREFKDLAIFEQYEYFTPHYLMDIVAARE